MTLVPPIKPHDPAPLRDRVVLITGGAQGIGRGIAQSVLGAGGRVLIGEQGFGMWLFIGLALAAIVAQQQADGIAPSMGSRVAAQQRR